MKTKNILMKGILNILLRLSLLSSTKGSGWDGERIEKADARD